MEVLSVKNLSKTYPEFTLENVSFSVKQGSIMGFIGLNGAGKTTTLKSLVNLVHPDGGSVKFFGEEFASNEQKIKERISFALGGVNYFQRKKIRTITGVYRKFYKGWSDSLYRQYLARFSLNEEKRIIELSEGMKVKYALALALSHRAELLLLDEPTSGLDPVSRDDLLELFLDLVEDGKTSILFSTQITSDLEKCADTITYIKQGRIISSMPTKEMVSSFNVIQGKNEALTAELSKKLIGCKSRAGEFSALIPAEDVKDWPNANITPASIESIMIYMERG